MPAEQQFASTKSKAPQQDWQGVSSREGLTLAVEQEVQAASKGVDAQQVATDSSALVTWPVKVPQPGAGRHAKRIS